MLRRSRRVLILAYVIIQSMNDINVRVQYNGGLLPDIMLLIRCTTIGERTYDVLSIQRESGNGTKNTRKKRHLQINIRKKERKKHAWLSGRMHIEERLN